MIKLKDILLEITEERSEKISKIEEYKALQLIRSKVIPQSVLVWNRVHADRYPKITEDEVRKKVTKRQNDGYIESRDTHYITYQVNFIKKNKPIVINYFINKDRTGIFITYQDIYGNSGMGERFILKEGIDNTISKVEEGQALDFIKKEMIPAALASYNQYHEIHNFKPVTAEEIRKNLKKTDQDFPNITSDQRGLATHSVYDPRIYYDAIIKGPIILNTQKWTFTILKSGKDGQCYVSWKHPYNFSGRWNPVKFS